MNTTTTAIKAARAHVSFYYQEIFNVVVNEVDSKLYIIAFDIA